MISPVRMMLHRREVTFSPRVMTLQRAEMTMQRPLEAPLRTPALVQPANAPSRGETVSQAVER
jgi:hypothetical protein